MVLFDECLELRGGIVADDLAQLCARRFGLEQRS